jgi:hypothetical protein
MIQRVMVIIVQLPLALPTGMECLGMMCNLPASERRYCWFPLSRFAPQTALFAYQWAKLFLR